MATKIVLHIENGLDETEQDDLRYLLSDALGEFAARRYPEVDYVRGRHAELRGDALEDKVRQVMRRNTLAHKLSHASFTMEMQPAVSLEAYDDAHLRALYANLEVKAEQDRQAIAAMQGQFGMTEQEARATFNQMMDGRIEAELRARGLR